MTPQAWLVASKATVAVVFCGLGYALTALIYFPPGAADDEPVEVAHDAATAGPRPLAPGALSDQGLRGHRSGLRSDC